MCCHTRAIARVSGENKLFCILYSGVYVGDRTDRGQKTYADTYIF